MIYGAQDVNEYALAAIREDIIERGGHSAARVRLGPHTAPKLWGTHRLSMHPVCSKSYCHIPTDSHLCVEERIVKHVGISSAKVVECPS